MPLAIPDCLQRFWSHSNVFFIVKGLTVAIISSLLCIKLQKTPHKNSLSFKSNKVEKTRNVVVASTEAVNVFGS